MDTGESLSWWNILHWSCPNLSSALETEKFWCVCTQELRGHIFPWKGFCGEKKRKWPHFFFFFLRITCKVFGEGILRRKVKWQWATFPSQHQASVCRKEVSRNLGLIIFILVPPASLKWILHSEPRGWRCSREVNKTSHPYFLCIYTEAISDADVTTSARGAAKCETKGSQPLQNRIKDA